MYSRLEDQEPKGLGALCYVIFLGTFEWGMVIPTLWPLLQRMGSPEMYFGLVIGTFSLTRVICQPIIGALGDRWDFQVLLWIVPRSHRQGPLERIFDHPSSRFPKTVAVTGCFLFPSPETQVEVAVRDEQEVSSALMRGVRCTCWNWTVQLVLFVLTSHVGFVATQPKACLRIPRNLGKCRQPCASMALGAGPPNPWATVEAAYDRISANFAESRRFPWPFVVKWLGASRRDTLLVAGCGDGRHVQTALDLGFRRIFALDLSEGMLQAAQRRLGDSGESVVFLHGDTRSVPLPDESVQDVLSCAVLHHLPLAESRAALEDFRRLLRPGGRLLASCWDPRAKAVTKRGKPAEDGIEAHAYWVAWRCADGSDVQRWYHLPPLEVRLQSWSEIPGLLLEKVELDGDNQVFEWRKLPATGS
eukprot:s383_g12.t2